MDVKYDYKNALSQIGLTHRQMVINNDKRFGAKAFRVVVLMSSDTLDRLKEEAGEYEFGKDFFFTDPSSTTFESVADLWYPLPNTEVPASAGVPVRLGFMPHMKFKFLVEEGTYN